MIQWWWVPRRVEDPYFTYYHSAQIKPHDCKSEAHLIEMYCKKHFFQQYDSNTLILRGPTLGSDCRGYSPWHRGVKVEEVGRGEGTLL